LAEPPAPVPCVEPESPQALPPHYPAFELPGGFATAKKFGRSKTKPQNLPPPHSSAFVFPAGFISASVRGGYRKYDGVSEYEHIGRNVMFMYGGMAGKRFALKNRRLRFQFAAEAGWGSAEEDVYDYETNYHIFEKSSEYIQLSTFGFQTDMHILFPAYARAYFLSAGPSLHRSSFSFSLKNNDKLIWKSGNINTLSPGLNIGAGIESTLNEHRAVSFAYNLRIWRPVYYTETGDLFPMGVQYDEFFYTHSFHVQVLLPGTKKGSFFR